MSFIRSTSLSLLELHRTETTFLSYSIHCLLPSARVLYGSMDTACTVPYVVSSCMYGYVLYSSVLQLYCMYLYVHTLHSYATDQSLYVSYCRTTATYIEP